MSRPNLKDVEPPNPPASEPAKESPGQVVVDNRGRNVWKWAKDVLDSTSVLLKRLENKDLALEPTRKVPILGGREKAGDPKAAKPEDAKTKTGKVADAKTPSRHPALHPPHKRDGGGGFDPYNTR